jgi:hypothetical protein
MSNMHDRASVQSLPIAYFKSAAEYNHQSAIFSKLIFANSAVQ